ncbi:hypothetical protein CC86DRAFT_6845 [Ophiobolus disseminans]|uniref:Uncharacterized protein n=1 Tax=Ophiobolus disseminans TaxID=1469910 RepID=A0A6A7AKJ3_9PLEO|nr:hypothetical protein CC86DRAFT_6845 [Ophiobolus disseminans]
MAYNGDDNDYNDRTSRAQISQPSPPDFWTAPEPSTAGGTDDGNFVGLQPSGNSFYVDDDTAWPSQKLSSSSSDASNIPARYFIDDLVRERLSHGPHGEPRPIDTASAAGHADQAAADSWKEPDLAQVSSGSECQPYDMCSQSRSYDDDGTMAGEIQRQLGHEHIEYSGSPIDPDFLLGDEYWFKEPCGESRPSYTRSVNNMACVNAELAPQYREPHTQSQGWTGAGVMQPSTNCGPAVQNNMGYEPREGPWTAFSATNFAQPQSYVYVSRNTTSHGNQTGSFHTSEESWGHVHMGMSSVIDDETTDTSFDPNFDDTMEASGYTARPPFSKPQEQQQQSWASTRSGSEYQDALEADVDMDYQHDRTERRPW